MIAGVKEKRGTAYFQDRFLRERGHVLSYAGIFLFTFVLYFRPYELVPALSGFNSIAQIVAIATLAVYLPSQLYVEGRITILTTEVACLLFLVFWAAITIPFATDPLIAWETFSETLLKVAIIFVIAVNVVRTPKRLKSLIWLSIGIGILLSYQALELYIAGEFKTEGYRISVDSNGMFVNANDLAMHLVIFAPIAIALGVAAKRFFSRIIYFVFAILMIVGVVVTQSRGGFLGLIAVFLILVWKIGKEKRLKAVSIAVLIAILFVMLAPGNYGIRLLSIFDSSFDPNGSASSRSQLLWRSIWVTLRNPLGVGLGNSPIFGIHNQQTHNSYTQISSELGLPVLIAYVTMMISPIRKLAAIENDLFRNTEQAWIYYLSIGIQASIVGYMITSFFGSVAYGWYLYYPIAYAIALRRIYVIEVVDEGSTTPSFSRSWVTKKEFA